MCLVENRAIQESVINKHNKWNEIQSERTHYSTDDVKSGLRKSLFWTPDFSAKQTLRNHISYTKRKQSEK